MGGTMFRDRVVGRGRRRLRTSARVSRNRSFAGLTRAGVAAWVALVGFRGQALVRSKRGPDEGYLVQADEK